MFKFSKDVFIGLFKAFKTDVNVFLIGVAAPCLMFRRIKGIGIALLFYTALRRADDLMGVYVNLKSQELSAINKTNDVPNE